MRDLTPLIRRAAKQASEWSEVQVAEVLSAVASRLPNAVVDWEPGDEEWGRVLLSDSVVALVSSRFPLVFVSQSANLVTEQLPDSITVETVESMDASEFAVDKVLLEETFQRPLSDNIAYAHISINELWWATT